MAQHLDTVEVWSAYLGEGPHVDVEGQRALLSDAGVTERMIPASLYSTVWVMELPVITTFLFSLVMMDGLEST